MCRVLPISCVCVCACVCVCVCARARATHTHRRLPRSTNHFYCPEYRTPALASDYNTYTGMTLECMREDRRGRCCAKTGDTGMYAAQLRRWFRVFRRDQFLILNSQLLNSNQTDIIARLGRFLGLAASLGPLGSEGGGGGGWATWVNMSMPSKNAASKADGGNKRAWGMANVAPAVCRRLRDAFAPHNQALYDLLAETRAQAPPDEPLFPPFLDPCPEVSPRQSPPHRIFLLHPPSPCSRHFSDACRSCRQAEGAPVRRRHWPGRRTHKRAGHARRAFDQEKRVIERGPQTRAAVAGRGKLDWIALRGLNRSRLSSLST